MNDTQRATIDSYGRITDFNDRRSIPLATIPDYAGEQAIFDDAVAAIVEALKQQQADTAGVALDSATLKKAMAKIVVKYASRGKVKAKRAGNKALTGQLAHSVTYINKAAKELALTRARDMRDALNNNLAICTNVSAGNITEIDKAIADYINAKEQPVEQIQIKKAYGTDVIPDQILIADDAVDNMLDLIHSYFDDVDTKLVDEFRLMMQIINTGIHHTIINILTVRHEDGKPILDSTVLDVTNNKTYKPDDTGNVHIAHHRSGHHHFTISAPGRNTLDIAADIKRSTENNFTAKLGAGDDAGTGTPGKGVIN